MCGRYSLFTPEKITPQYHLTDSNLDFEAHYNIAPGSSNPVIVRQSPKSAKLMRWGLIPSYAKDISIGYRLINARSETVENKPTFKRLLVHNRCCVPANGYFEWQQAAETKLPYYFYPQNTSLFSFAGLYDTWKDAEGVEIQSYAILTRQAVSPLDSIHHRMPVILSASQVDIWLDHTHFDKDAALKVLRQKTQDKIIFKPVSSQVNNANYDEPEVIQSI